MSEIKSATDLENLFAKLLNKSTREVVGLFEFFEDEGHVIAVQPRKTYLEQKDWMAVFRCTKDLGGKVERDEDTGCWQFKFPKAPVAPKQDLVPSPEKPTSPSPSTQQEKPENPVAPGYYPEFPVDRILSPPFTFRHAIGEDIDTLMTEIEAAGMIIEPLIARPSKTVGHVEAGPGERRLLAARRLGMKTVPLIVREMDDVEFDRVRLLENLARKDLSDLELAHVLQYLLQKYPKEYPTQEALAQDFGKTQGWVAQHLAMLQLEKDEIITRVIKPEKLSEFQAREILAAPPEKRVEVAEKIAKHIEMEGEAPSAREIRKIVQPEIRVKCVRCGAPTLRPVEVDGQQYCQVCSAVVKPAPKPKAESVPKPLISRVEYESTTLEESPEPIDTGVIFECPECHETYTIIHVARGKHRFQPVTIMGDE